jgi:hypothetical protein
MGDEMGAAHGRVVSARRSDGIEVHDDGLVFADEGEFVIEVVAGRDLPPGAIDVE